MPPCKNNDDGAAADYMYKFVALEVLWGLVSEFKFSDPKMKEEIARALGEI